jgi:hypothetical protein
MSPPTENSTPKHDWDCSSEVAQTSIADKLTAVCFTRAAGENPACANGPFRYDACMKLLLSSVVYLVLAALFCWGIILMMAGKPGLLLGLTAVYVVLFAKIGCMTH